MAERTLGWLAAEGRRVDGMGDLMTGLVERLDADGFDLCRVTSGVPILHPQVFSSSWLWHDRTGLEERRFRVGGEAQPTTSNSPIPVIYGGGGPIRLRIGPVPDEDEYLIVPELRDDGVTDYLAAPAPFSDGTVKAMTYATRRNDGFSEDEIRSLLSISDALAPLLEIHALRSTATTLLETYVGRMTGARVLAGNIHRGQGEAIDSVIWFSDLRGFTPFSETASQEEVLSLLDDYFGAAVTIVEAHGGEVLKFIGDAVLAIFPFADSNRTSVAASALEAVAVFEREIERINGHRAAGDRSAIRFGVALHAGHVHYGNIGSDRRLDFTVIGPAVNLASRIEGLCAETGETVLFSDAFAGLLAEAPREVGIFALKGINGRHRVFRP